MSDTIMPIVTSVLLAVNVDEKSTAVVHAVQGDHLSRIIRAGFTDESIIYAIDEDASVSFVCIRPDGIMVEKDCEVDSSGQYAEVTLDENILQAYGNARANFIIRDVDAEQSMRSQEFTLHIGEKLDKEEAIPTDAPIPLAQQVRRNRDDIDNIKGNIAEIVNEYFRDHPVTGVTTAQITAAVNDYLANHPVSGVDTSKFSASKSGSIVSLKYGTVTIATWTDSDTVVNAYTKTESDNRYELKGQGGGTVSKPLGKVLLFGDSLNAGFVNGQNDVLPRWTTYLTNAEEVRNFAVGGSTWGTGYATGSGVANQSCEDMITAHNSDIQWADMIILAYAGNDINSCVSGTTTYDNVIAKAISCVDRIKTLNPTARLIYLYPNMDANYATDASSALKTSPLITALKYILWSKHVEVVDMLYGTYLTVDDIQSDGVHPNANGIEKIGRAMNDLLMHMSSYQPSKDITLYVGQADGANKNPFKYMFPFVNILNNYGISITVIFEAGGVPFKAHMSFCNASNNVATWIAHVYVSGTKLNRTNVYINNNGVGFNTLDTV